MIIDCQINIECDECGEIIPFEIQLAAGSVDQNRLKKEIENEGWRWGGWNQHFCPDCAQEKEDEEDAAEEEEYP